MYFTNEDSDLYQRLFHIDVPEVPAGVTLRAARVDDYQAIMGFSEGLLYGRDYLPGLYHRYMAHPTRYLYVAEIDGKVVSFNLCNNHDNNSV